LGLDGDRDFNVKLYQMGTYRQRQYEWYIADNVPFILHSMWEDVIDLGN